MRRKSERNKNKSSPEKKLVETPPQPTRKSKRHSRKQRSPSREDSDDDNLKVDKSPQQITPSKSPSNSDDEAVERPIWKVQTADSASGEIQKIKICLTRPAPTTPERREKSPRRKRHKSANQDGDGEERTSRKSRRRGSSAVTNLEDSLSNSNSQESQEDEGKFNKDKTEAHEILAESVHDTSEPVQAQIINQNEPKSGQMEELKTKITEPVEQQSMDVKLDVGKNENEEIMTPGVDKKESAKETAESKDESNIESNDTQEEEIVLKPASPIEMKESHDKTPEVTEIVPEISTNEEEPVTNAETEETIQETDEVRVTGDSEKNEVIKKVLTNEEEIELTQSIASINQISEKETRNAISQQIQPEMTQNQDEIERENKEEKMPKQQAEDISQKSSFVNEIGEEKITEPISDSIESSTETVADEKPQCEVENLKETVQIVKEDEKVQETKKTVQIPINEGEQCEIINTTEAVPLETEEEIEGWEVVNNEEIEEIKRLEKESSKKGEASVKETPVIQEEKSERIVNKERRHSDESSSDSSSESSDDNARREIKHVQKDLPKMVASENKEDRIEMETTEVETSVIEPETSVNEPVEERRKRTWTRIINNLPKITIITSDTVKSICPNVEMIPEDQLRLEVKAERRERKSYERKVSIEQKEEPNKTSNESEDVSTNVISMNRKISIVDDEASKLQPPPQPAKHPVSAVLFITSLVRPFTLKQLKELLSRTGNIVENGFWTDRIKSKCYVQYENEV